MLENSYDGKGLRFGILCGHPSIIKSYFGEEQSLEENQKDIEKLYSSGNVRFIDFDKLDGLTIGEVEETLERVIPDNKIVFVMYNQAELTFEKPNIFVSPKQVVIINYNEENKQRQLDEVVEDTILSQFDSMPDPIKKYAKCFLQRYRYGTKEETDIKIMQYKAYND